MILNFRNTPIIVGRFLNMTKVWQVSDNTLRKTMDKESNILKLKNQETFKKFQV
jgi:hypothetical protein